MSHDVTHIVDRAFLFVTVADAPAANIEAAGWDPDTDGGRDIWRGLAVAQWRCSGNALRSEQRREFVDAGSDTDGHQLGGAFLGERPARLGRCAYQYELAGDRPGSGDLMVWGDAGHSALMGSFAAVLANSASGGTSSIDLWSNIGNVGFPIAGRDFPAAQAQPAARGIDCGCPGAHHRSPAPASRGART